MAAITPLDNEPAEPAAFDPPALCEKAKGLIARARVRIITLNVLITYLYI